MKITLFQLIGRRGCDDENRFNLIEQLKILRTRRVENPKKDNARGRKTLRNCHLGKSVIRSMKTKICTSVNVHLFSLPFLISYFEAFWIYWLWDVISTALSCMEMDLLQCTRKFPAIVLVLSRRSRMEMRRKISDWRALKRGIDEGFVVEEECII